MSQLTHAWVDELIRALTFGHFLVPSCCQMTFEIFYSFSPCPVCEWTNCWAGFQIKSIPIFAYNQWVLSPGTKTKVAQHVLRIKMRYLPFLIPCCLGQTICSEISDFPHKTTVDQNHGALSIDDWPLRLRFPAVDENIRNFFSLLSVSYTHLTLPTKA